MAPVAYVGTVNATDMPLDERQLTAELQYARCMSKRYDHHPFPRCVACTRRWAGDTCRFQGIRFFLKDDGGKTHGTSFVVSQKQDSPTLTFPIAWDIPLDSTHIKVIKVSYHCLLLVGHCGSIVPYRSGVSSSCRHSRACRHVTSHPTTFSYYLQTVVARALLPPLREEVKHLNLKGVIKRPREVDVRVTCGSSL